MREEGREGRGWERVRKGGREGKQERMGEQNDGKEMKGKEMGEGKKGK